MRLVLMLFSLAVLGGSPAHAADLDRAGAHSETVPVGFRLPDRVGLSVIDSDGTELMDAYHVLAIPIGCSATSIREMRPYEEAGTIRLDQRCDWTVTLSLGAGGEQGLREVYYQSAAFFLRRSDLASKVKLDLSFQLSRQEAGTSRGFKPHKLF